MWMERTCGDLEVIIEKLNDMVPLTGPCEKRFTKNKALDRFRRAQNVVHDIFNNGLMNRGRELRVIDKNLRTIDLPIFASNKDKWDIVEDRISNQYRKIVMDAVLEQFGREGYLKVSHNRSNEIITKAISEGRVQVASL